MGVGVKELLMMRVGEEGAIPSAVLRWFRSFSSRRHFARLLLNHTWGREVMGSEGGVMGNDGE